MHNQIPSVSSHSVPGSAPILTSSGDTSTNSQLTPNNEGATGRSLPTISSPEQARQSQHSFEPRRELESVSSARTSLTLALDELRSFLLINGRSATPESMENLSERVMPNLSDNVPTSLPGSIANLSPLGSLNIADSRPTSLPNRIENGSGQLAFNAAHNYSNVNQLSDPSDSSRSGQYRVTADIGLERNAVETAVPARQEKADREYSIDINTFNENEQETLNNWLTHLTSTADHHGVESRQQLADTVFKIMQDLVKAEHADFKTLFFATLADNLAGCGDRAGMSLNQLFTLWKVECEDGGKDLPDTLAMFAGLARTNLLTNAVTERLQKAMDEGHIGSLRESVETQIYWVTELKPDLNLVTAIDKRRFEMNALNPSIKSALISQVKEGCLQEMAGMEVIQKKWMTLSSEQDRQPLTLIEDEMEHLDEQKDTLTSKQYESQSIELQEKYQSTQAELVVSWIKQNLPDAERQLLGLQENKQ